jgi:hypothetical protein
MRASGPQAAPTADQKIKPTTSDSAHDGKDSGLGARTFAILTLGAAGMACLMALLPAAGHDQMWCLYMARLVLHGVRLYGPQLFESNPPLIVWISMLPETLSDWLHLAPTAVGKLLVVALEAGVAAVSLRLFRSLRPRADKATLWVLAFAFVVVFAGLPARDFGQRDHILALLCLPYVLAAALDATGRPLPTRFAVLVGLAAAVGIALKPHEVLLPIAVETTLLALRSRDRGRRVFRPEQFALVTVGLAYLFAIRHFAADYFTQVIPVLRSTYWAFGHLTWPQLVGESIQLHILAAVTLAAFFVTGRRSRSALTTLTALLIAAGIAGTFAYYLQGTGWYYQQLPALSFFSLALTLLAVDAAQAFRLAMPAWAPKAAAGLAVLALALTTHFAGYPFTAARSFPIDTPDPAFYAGLAPGTPVATLTTTLDYTVPLAFKFNLALAQRYPHLWMLPAILRGESGDRRLPPPRLAELEQLQHAAMLQDFARWQPRLVLVERCQDPTVHCQVLEDRHDDLLAWFLRDPAFREVFRNYHYLRSSGTFDAYVPN